MSQGFGAQCREHLSMSLPPDSPTRPFGDLFDELVTKPITTNDDKDKNKIDLEIESHEKENRKAEQESTSNSESLFPYSSSSENVLKDKWKNLAKNDSPINIYISMPKEVEVVNSISRIDGKFL